MMGQRPGNNTESFSNSMLNSPNGISNRPDLALGRGASYLQQQQQPQGPPGPLSGRSEPTPQRAEMRGPSTDIDSILSGLKTRVAEPPSNFAPPQQSVLQPPPPPMQEIGSEYGMDSMISVSSLRDMQDGNIPKRSRRRNNNSRGNTVSLDI